MLITSFMHRLHTRNRKAVIDLINSTPYLASRREEIIALYKEHDKQLDAIEVIGSRKMLKKQHKQFVRAFQRIIKEIDAAKEKHIRKTRQLQDVMIDAQLSPKQRNALKKFEELLRAIVKKPCYASRYFELSQFVEAFLRKCGNIKGPNAINTHRNYTTVFLPELSKMLNKAKAETKKVSASKTPPKTRAS